MATTTIFSLSLPAAISFRPSGNLSKALFPTSRFHPDSSFIILSPLGHGNRWNYQNTAKSNNALVASSSPRLVYIPSASPVEPASVPECSFQSEIPPRPWQQEHGIGATFLRWVLVWAPVCCSLLLLLECRSASAAVSAASDSIRASKIGLKIATLLRGTGWPDEAIVFSLATLPVLELRGAIPVGYWMQLDPVLVTTLSVLGNMVPVPFIILYLKKIASLASQRGNFAARFLDLLLKRARDKAEPVREFQWLGLMLFVAVPFPGTGAWTGAIVASVLDMPFWSAASANFVGVVLAAVLVNLLVNLGLKHAVAVGLALFLVSTFMWTALRRLQRAFPK